MKGYQATSVSLSLCCLPSLSLSLHSLLSFSISSSPFHKTRTHTHCAHTHTHTHTRTHTSVWCVVTPFRFFWSPWQQELLPPPCHWIVWLIHPSHWNMQTRIYMHTSAMYGWDGGHCNLTQGETSAVLYPWLKGLWYGSIRSNYSRGTMLSMYSVWLFSVQKVLFSLKKTMLWKNTKEKLKLFYLSGEVG